MTETPERPQPEMLDICRDCDGSGEDGTPTGVCSQCNGSGGTPRSSAFLEGMRGESAHSSDSCRTPKKNPQQETPMEQAQVLAKWLDIAKDAKQELRGGNVTAGYKAVDRLAVHILLGKIFGLPHDVAIYREEARDVINAYVESVIARVESIAWRGSYDVEKHARDAKALDELLGALPSRDPGGEA